MLYVVTTADGDHSMPIPWALALKITQDGNNPEHWWTEQWRPYRMVQENLYTGSIW